MPEISKHSLTTYVMHIERALGLHWPCLCTLVFRFWLQWLLLTNYAYFAIFIIWNRFGTSQSQRWKLFMSSLFVNNLPKILVFMLPLMHTFVIQDPNNKNIVHCDAKLKSILLGKTQVELAELPMLIKLHFPKVQKWFQFLRLIHV